MDHKGELSCLKNKETKAVKQSKESEKAMFRGQNDNCECVNANTRKEYFVHSEKSISKGIRSPCWD
jgi:hypothetical protein